MKCEECETEFKPYGCKRFCSQLCQQKNWQKRNREKLSKKQLEHNKRKSKKKICVVCNGEIPYGSRRYKCCSEECYIEYSKTYKDNYNKTLQKSFDEYKLLQGCKICGYNKCAGSLHFHHTEGKDFQINAPKFFSNLQKNRNEISKCILVCANCHGELHQNWRISF